MRRPSVQHTRAAARFLDPDGSILMISANNRPRALRTTAVALGFLALGAPAVHAQWVQTHEQFYLQAPHNWQFRDRYQAADRLFNAFDFGHAILYEVLWTKPRASTAELEEKWYDRLTTDILVRPPRVPLEEGAIEIGYVKLAPEAKLMFEWAHILHRQVYDVLADETLTAAGKDAEIARILAYYKTRPDLAFSSRPKSMALMQEQPYSLAFRRNYPKFNGLIWAYHWLQVGLYEPLLVHETPEQRQAGVRATVARFWQMLENPPAKMPHLMPMTAAVAPRFTERYPEAAIIFDNLHSMHDVISDILANPSVPRDRKRAEILLAARRFRDDTSYVMTPDAWRTMAQHMGIENMGGPAVGFLPELPAPTVTYGAVMTHDDRTGAMTGFSYGSATGGSHAGMEHGAEAAPRDTLAAAQDPHAGHAMPGADSAADRTVAPMHDERMMEMHMRMMADSVIRAQMMADTAMHRMMMEMMPHMPAEHREMMERMMRTRADTTRVADPHAGHEPARPPETQPTRPAMKPAVNPTTRNPVAVSKSPFRSSSLP